MNKLDILFRKIIGSKRPQILAMVKLAPAPEKKGLVLQGTRVKAKPAPKPKRKITALAKARAEEVNALIALSPSRGLKLAVAYENLAKAERAKRARINAMSQEEKDIEKAKLKLVKEALQSLTKSLPPVGTINVNHSPVSIVGTLARYAFDSALSSGVLFTATERTPLALKSGPYLIPVSYTLLDPVFEKLRTYSGASSIHKMTGNDLGHHLKLRAWNHKVVESKKLSSEDYLSLLIKKSIAVELKFLKSTGRVEVRDLLTMAIAEEAVKLGFTVCKRKKLWVDSSDNSHGSTEIPAKLAIETIKEIVKGSSVYGRLTGGTVPGEIYEGILNLIKLN